MSSYRGRQEGPQSLLIHCSLGRSPAPTPPPLYFLILGSPDIPNTEGEVLEASLSLLCVAILAAFLRRTLPSSSSQLHTETLFLGHSCLLEP